METQAIIEILKSHMDKSQVTLERAKDCKGIWTRIVIDVYGSIPTTIDGIEDTTVKSVMYEFENEDSLELVNKKGRILKRFSNYWKSKTGTKITDRLIGIIGDIMQRHLSASDAVYTYDFRDVIDWNDGMYGKDDSCWWGCFSSSKDVYIDNGGWGIRFYDGLDDRQGSGRTWILPRDGILIGFNSYGVSRAQTSKVIKAIFAQHGIVLHYRSVDVVNSPNSEIPYINGDTGFILYPEGMEESELLGEYDLNMESDGQEDDDRATCEHCSRRINMDYDSYESIGGSIYCSNCASTNFSFCDKCQEWYDPSDVHSVENHSYYFCLCEHCAKMEDYTECYECNNWVNETVMDSDGDSFCEECAEKHLIPCDHCEEYFYGTHECPASLDYSGLVESVETLHAQIRSKDYSGDSHENVTVYRLENCQGITLFNPHMIDKSCSDEWNISHDVSGLAIKSNLSFASAKTLLLRLSQLPVDWNQPSDVLIGNKDIMTQVVTAIREITQ